jgi:hypothetical protein
MIEACRPSVIYATREDTVVSCTEARWICSADAECGKALEYYHLYCRSMFRGRKCSQRCKNSLSILRRQEKAAKLRLCECEANEQIDSFQCSDIKQNMEELCFEPETEQETTTILYEDLEDEISENEIFDSDGIKKTLNKASLVVKIQSFLLHFMAVILVYLQ